MLEARVAAAQMKPELINRAHLGKILERNALRVLDMAKQASQLGVHAVVFPELCITGYCIQDKQLVKDAIGQFEKYYDLWFRTFAAEKGIIMAVGVPDRLDDEFLFDSCNIYTPSGTLKQHKSRLWENETYLFSHAESYLLPGEPRDIAFQSLDIQGMKAGAAICFDYFSSDIPGMHSHMGHQLILLPSAWVKTVNQTPMNMICHKNLREISSRTGQIIINASRTGEERCYIDGSGDVTRFLGGSSITGPGYFHAIRSEIGLLVADLGPEGISSRFVPVDKSIKYP